MHDGPITKALFILLLIPISNPVFLGMGQPPLQLPIGAERRFEIKALPGTVCYWSVLEQLALYREISSEKVTFLTDYRGSLITLKWKKAGIYYLQVVVTNQNGCSNRKLIQVDVWDNHPPVATDDYASTSWIKNITVHVLNNDRDDGGDIDPSSLKILTKPEFGQVVPSKDGTITYIPLQNQAGSQFFSYRICDACNQCDTARVSIEVHEPPLFLPQGLTPNGDGVNDRFVIKGLEAYPNSSLTIFARNGMVVFSSDNYDNDWEGSRINSNHERLPLPPGTYYYLLLPGGSRRFIKGFIYLSY